MKKISIKIKNKHGDDLNTDIRFNPEAEQSALSYLLSWIQRIQRLGRVSLSYGEDRIAEFLLGIF